MHRDLRAIAHHWHLSAAETRQLATLAAGAPHGVADCCRDIDRALHVLLADRIAERGWLRRPHPLLYSTPPLGFLLGSAAGLWLLRRILLSEASLCDGAARAALAAR